ncbi:MAG: hypothetical protein COA37_17810 [Hoeflea sp.]|uniref:hypothetical protein n=1 Tax=Hoeflea sp. TaxID=1940281 RepID=UPI000C0DE520|nr:hypothetical protein [Hoeflea sp.]PHR19409.1 MAG: hypothetical protein COA37_17810 [Hoeflea sp.]
MTQKSTTAEARIEVFRSGVFTPMNGMPITFGAADLAGIATSYDPDNAPAPIVVGHPKTDAPAFGWASSFDYDAEADRLFADLDDIAPEFAEAVRAGHYKKVSMSFFPPDAANNPTPGSWYPKHIGFLGAAAPAVPGLRNIAFAEDPEVITFEASFGEAAFGERGFEDAASLFRNLREWIIDKFSLEEADKVLPAYRLEWLDNTEIDPGKSGPAFAGRPTPASSTTKKVPDMTKPDPKPADFAAREAEIAARETKLAEREQKARHDDHEAFAESLIEAGKFAPVQKDNLVAILDALPVETAVSFSESDKSADRPIADALKALLEAQPKFIDFGQADLGEDPTKVNQVSFASDGKAVDPDQLALDAKAQAFMSQNPGTDYLTAVRAVGG